ncbi:putative F-box/kelch-repeat protein [Cardamine amara subsp. amara]|uniref:F-box/kelch-repeat protein n=1 Tax=Cardamine amara subsp. amara TaxID=228776 RepID=A0ABD0ZGQ3_CARAN
MNGEEPPFKRRRRMTILMLPDDLVLNCLARVSKLYYPILSLVSKRFRSIIASTELYQTRIHLGCTESCLYVCLQLDADPKTQYVCSHYVKDQLTPSFPPARHSDATMVGTNIYDIGGLTSDKDYTASSRVMVMDCHSHTWR